MSRVPAAELEALVIRSVRHHLKSPAAMDDRSLIETHIARVEVHPERLIVRFAQGERATNDPAGPEDMLSSLGKKQQRRAVAKFSCQELIHETPAGYAPKIARLCSPPLPAAVAGLKNSSSNQPQPRKRLPNARAAPPAR